MLNNMAPKYTTECPRGLPLKKLNEAPQIPPVTQEVFRTGTI
jgi:hypothetical protein